MPQQKGQGWIPDEPDFRDHKYEAPRMQGLVAGVGPQLPKKVDFRELKDARGNPKLPPVFDQGAMGSCTGQAVSAAIGFLRPEAYRHSRLFIYYNARVRGGNVGIDNGATIRNAIKGAASEGAAMESLWAYEKGNLLKKPSIQAYTDGAPRKIGEYLSIVGLENIKSALAATHPVVFGFTVYKSFHGASVAKTGLMPMPTATDRAGGGHAVMAVGYDDAKQQLIVRNSWGAKWGDKGYFYMPYAYLPLTSAWWTIRA